MSTSISEFPFHVELYTDGAASGNPGPGGYGIVLICNGHYKELSAGYSYTTNNRMELLAVIVGLEALKQDGCLVQVFTDSSYVVNAVTKHWLLRWEKTQFKNVKNPDLWVRFLRVYRRHSVKMHWIKGHAGHLYNERCDHLAVTASMQPKLAEDLGYLNRN
ncbi:MAG: ribonuclease HI [Prevotellaceae bacterium]|jgi:ribonuclease HI|nr:ribonuclease HI [Prevotellaceae bacterium]